MVVYGLWFRGSKSKWVKAAMMFARESALKYQLFMVSTFSIQLHYMKTGPNWKYQTWPGIIFCEHNASEMNICICMSVDLYTQRTHTHRISSNAMEKLTNNKNSSGAERIHWTRNYSVRCVYDIIGWYNVILQEHDSIWYQTMKWERSHKNIHSRDAAEPPKKSIYACERPHKINWL